MALSDAIHMQERQTGTQMATEACGFTTIVIGTFLLHATRELDVSLGEHPAVGAERRCGLCVTISLIPRLISR